MSVPGRAVLVAAVLVLAVGCGSAAQPANSEQAEHHAQRTGQPVPQQAPQQAQQQAQQQAETSDKTISVRISEGRVEGVPARVEVDRGTQVRIEVTSDRSDELHVHGYDKTVPLPAGSPAAVAFVADLPGVFEVETHDSELLLFQLVVLE